MKFRNAFLFLFFVVILTQFSHAQKGLWSEVSHPPLGVDVAAGRELPKHYRIFRLDLKQMQQQLLQFSENHTGTDNTLQLKVPGTDGKERTFLIKNYAVMAPELAKKYPGNRSFTGVGVDDPSERIRLTINELGLHVMLTDAHRKVMLIDPYSKDKQYYIGYNRADLNPEAEHFVCLTKTDPSSLKKTAQQKAAVDDKKLYIYRLALAATGEYSQYHVAASGVQDPTDAEQKAIVLAEMTTLVTRINDVYENDLAVSLQLIANNDKLIYLDGDNDPYSNDDGDAMLSENQTNVDNVIGTANYDIGHVLSTGGGGVASLGSVCTYAKARGVTGASNPKGDYFYYDFVAHEMGHQFGANHTFNGDAQNCGGGNRNVATAVEPGSGSTLMAYAGICSPQNVQSHSDFYFHTVSIDEIRNFIANGSCAVKKDLTTNLHVPVADAGADYTIPASTPYVLRGTGSDADNDPITFCWEQIDAGVTAIPPSSTATSGALYRSFNPKVEANRYMPSLSTVIKGDVSSTWEVTPSVSRKMNFALTVRDNNSEGGQVAKDEMQVSVVDAAGPFMVTSQNTDGIVWEKGTAETVTWDVAGTTANGVNVSKVNIYLSTDGGRTFTTPLLMNTPNDGSESITVPDIAAAKCYVMVEAVDNIFFSTNSKAFSIGKFKEVCYDYSATDVPLNIPDDNPTGVVSEIDVKEAFTIEKVRVTAKLTHTWIGDITMVLESPAGKTVELVGTACFGSGYTDLDATFDDDGADLKCSNTPPAIQGVIIPSQPLSVNNGDSSFGKWKLTVVDGGDQDVGTIDSWSLQLCTSEEILAVRSEALENFKVYPNPVTDVLHIEFASPEDSETRVAVFDLLGRKVYGKKFRDSSLHFNKNIDLSRISRGVYLLQVKNGSRVSASKIVLR